MSSIAEAEQPHGHRQADERVISCNPEDMLIGYHTVRSVHVQLWDALDLGHTPEIHARTEPDRVHNVLETKTKHR